MCWTKPKLYRKKKGAEPYSDSVWKKIERIPSPTLLRKRSTEQAA